MSMTTYDDWKTTEPDNDGPTPICATCGAVMDRYMGPTPNGAQWFVCPNSSCDDDEHGSEQDDSYAGLL